jgi:hypothetical protein
VQDSRPGLPETTPARAARRRFIVAEVASEDGAAPEAGPVADLLRQLDEAQRMIDHLHVALTSNRRIGMAMGTLMARHGCTENDAFDRLRSVSQHLHRKLRDVAEYVVLAGELPTG